MLVGGERIVGASFYAPGYWVALWEFGSRPVAFGGFSAELRPLMPSDEVRAVRDPCRVELALVAAVGGLRETGARLDGWWSDRWTASLGGWRGYDVDGAPPPFVVAAVRDAYPLPRTSREAHDECAYWAWRAYMIAMVLDEGDEVLDALRRPELDLVCQVRLKLVRRLLTLEGLATSIEDVEARLRMYAFVDDRDHALEASVLCDLARLKTAAVAHPGTGRGTGRRAGDASRRGVRNAEVTAELRTDPTQSDRAVARKVGCHPTTVGDARRRLGLQDVVRSVRRGNSRPYSMGGRPKTRDGAVAAASTASPSGGAVPASTPPDPGWSRPTAPVRREGRGGVGRAGGTRAQEQLGLPWGQPLPEDERSNPDPAGAPLGKS